MNTLRQIGMHIRLERSLYQAALQAHELGCTIFQVFFVEYPLGHSFLLTKTDEHNFARIRPLFGNVYVHGSYHINLAHPGHQHAMLHKELALAQRLNLTHYVVHPGIIKNGVTKEQAMHAIASVLNTVLPQYPGITLLLENTAHGGKSVGSDLADLYALRTLITVPDQVGFCIDTAHAYAYGYDLATHSGRTDFFTKLERTVGSDAVHLLHLNDVASACGARVDLHAAPGHGALGTETFIALMQAPTFAHVPIIIEPPVLSLEEQRAMLHQVKAWNK